MTLRSQRPSNKWLLGAVTVSLFGSLFALGCRSKKEDSRVSPCTGAGCTTPCSATGTCSSGQYCGPNNTCTADCVQGGDSCGADRTCSASGKCEPVINAAGGMSGGIDTGNGDGGKQSGTDEDACVKLTVTFTPKIPTVVMLIDQSGSMNQAFGTGLRWNVLRDALIDPTTGIISTLQQKVRFGLALYTSNNGFGNNPAAPRVCPQITEVPPALDNFAAISAKYLPDDWKGDTPTGESIDAAVKILQGVMEEGPKVIVLATDGEPDSCADANPRGTTATEAARALSVEAVTNAFKANITTFVISVGNQVGQDHLRAVANAGQGLAVDIDAMNRFYLANNQSDLATAFDSIVSDVRSCELELNGSVEADSAGTGTVLLDDKPLSYMNADGWRLTSPTTLELQGAACSAIKTGDHDLKISFPCGVIVPK